ncbi:MAG: response regulator [Bacteroidales bacterium]|nr:response regulator [Bacteroidales bacterium]
MHQTKEIKVFIIEDDFVFIEILTNIIDSINEEIAEKKIKIVYNTYYSAKEAGFELSCNPDIVLLDYFIMDDELNADTGTKLLRDIKEHDASIEVIVVSGQESADVKDDLLKKGATAYISKDENSLATLKPLLMEIVTKRFA